MSDTDPQVAAFTTRGYRRDIFRCLGYEYEDAIVSEFHDGHLVEPVAAALGTMAFRARLWTERKGLDRLVHPGGGRTTGLGRDVDLFFAIPAIPADLIALSTIRDWRARSAFAVCHLQELWVVDIQKNMPWLRPILNRFDHVICMLRNSVEPLARELDVPVSYLPPSVDAESMCPWPTLPARIIDACAIGKMDPVTHEALWGWGQRTGRYYRFTTEAAAQYRDDHMWHRRALTQTLQRSKYFFTYRAKRDFIAQRKTQDEFGPRYFEGAAAGAVQLGDPLPGNPAYCENLDWEGAVVEAGFSSGDIPALIEELENRPDRIEEVRRANVVNCLTRHDHVYRWEKTLELAGLAPTPAMASRRARLEALAARVSAGLTRDPSRLGDARIG
jgi:hypothetical protein